MYCSIVMRPKRTRKSSRLQDLINSDPEHLSVRFVSNEIGKHTTDLVDCRLISVWVFVNSNFNNNVQPKIFGKSYTMPVGSYHALLDYLVIIIVQYVSMSILANHNNVSGNRTRCDIKHSPLIIAFTGQGLFTNQTINPGDDIVEYKGTLFQDDGALQSSGTYIYCFRYQDKDYR